MSFPDEERSRNFDDKVRAVENAGSIEELSAILTPHVPGAAWAQIPFEDQQLLLAALEVPDDPPPEPDEPPK